MGELTHSTLAVYSKAQAFLAQADGLIQHLPPGRAYIADQLARASLSISLNIAEGAGEFAAKEKARFYRIAKRSATECAGIIDSAVTLRLTPSTEGRQAQRLLFEIVSMLSRLIKNLESPADPRSK